MSQDAVINVLATCSYALQRVIELMNAGSLVFSESEASEASECFHLHIKSYMWLAAFFYQRRKIRWERLHMWETKLTCEQLFLWNSKGPLAQRSRPVPKYTWCMKSKVIVRK